MTDAQLEEHLKKFETELLSKVPSQRNWMVTIAVTILTGLSIIATGFIFVGRLDQRVTHVESSQAVVESKVATHHEDTARHVDSQWKADIRSDLNSIRQLLVEHMSDKQPQRRRNE